MRRSVSKGKPGVVCCIDGLKEIFRKKYVSPMLHQGSHGSSPVAPVRTPVRPTDVRSEPPGSLGCLNITSDNVLLLDGILEEDNGMPVVYTQIVLRRT